MRKMTMLFAGKTENIKNPPQKWKEQGIKTVVYIYLYDAHEK